MSKDRGRASRAMPRTDPFRSANTMSRGMNVFFIHIRAITSFPKSNSIPARGASERRNMRPRARSCGVAATSTS